VQHRLAAILPGAPVDADGIFGPGTRAALEAFQHRGACGSTASAGQQTWNTLVEAGFRLGDRFLYRRTPMLRGDDVADLQQRLCTLGFDTGRVDGIFGDRPSRALADFQRNAGLPVDGIVGGATLRELIRLESRHRRARARLRGAGPGRAPRRPPTLRGRHVAVGESGGLGSVTGALRRRLVLGGTRVTELHHPDDSAQAKEANELGVDVFVGLRLNPSTSVATPPSGPGHDESLGGRRLAELVQAGVPPRHWGHRRRRPRHVAAPPARDPHACGAHRGGPGQPGGRTVRRSGRRLATALGHWADASWD
jgi:N-acetylmuramoyl-L-alanine amidase